MNGWSKYVSKHEITTRVISGTTQLPDFSLQSVGGYKSSISQGWVIEKADQEGRATTSNIGSIGSRELKSIVI